MAKKKPYGDGHRIGAVKDRRQTHNPHNDSWSKHDSHRGRFTDQKADDKPFKGVRKEKWPESRGLGRGLLKVGLCSLEKIDSESNEGFRSEPIG